MIKEQGEAEVKFRMAKAVFASLAFQRRQSHLGYKVKADFVLSVLFVPMKNRTWFRKFISVHVRYFFMLMRVKEYGK